MLARIAHDRNNDDRFNQRSGDSAIVSQCVERLHLVASQCNRLTNY